MKTLSIVTACYNEEACVAEVYERVRHAVASLGDYEYEHIFIDNDSTDNTLGILKSIARRDKNVKIIKNTRNFGHIRSPFHAIIQGRGDAVISIVADLQDPPEMIPDLVRKWEEGYPVVVCVKNDSDESGLMFWIRRRYYRLVNRLSGLATYENFTGFGLYDRKVIDVLREFNDPYPYFRGMIAEVGLKHCELPYHQPARKGGITKNNFYSLYDMAMLGITNLSKIPLRMVIFAGLVGAGLSLLTAFGYTVYKLANWSAFTVGVAPIVIGVFFLASLQLIFLGIIGEYVGQIHTLVQKRPLVIEEERINFEYAPGVPVQDPRVHATDR